ncbi:MULTISPECIES: YiaA/YiaB family inner membrane protein [unclassified Mesorhizobium]|uniref:YiaA/YiaB family inner membrane protein n=1 Tax=unclassified Mesorhizobium TaxID=325217 RepID=UPI001FEF8FA9|nr:MULTISPECIES: YiaA/YiaB family inner membrane protein [unclassified Mesorhizobium]
MNGNQTYIMFNTVSVGAAYFMLGPSLWLAPVDLSTKGYWAMGILLLTGSLVNWSSTAPTSASPPRPPPRSKRRATKS